MLKTMLLSLCNQTTQNFNIIVINNASTDNTLEVCEEIIREYPERQITVITNEMNIGNIGNFRKAQSLASNKYTAVFCDDDAIHPEYIDAVLMLFKKHKNLIAVSGAEYPMYYVGADNWYPIDRGYYLVPKGCIAQFSLMIRRHSFQSFVSRTYIYKQVKYNHEKYGKLHDIVHMIEICEKGESAFLISPCIRAGQHANNDSFSYKSGPFPEEIVAIVKALESKLTRNRLDRVALWNFTYFLYCWSQFYKRQKLRWKDFIRMKPDGKDSVFSETEIWLYSNRFFIKIANYLLMKLSARLGRDTYRYLDDLHGLDIEEEE